MSVCLPTTTVGEPHIQLTRWSAFLLLLPVLGAPSIHVVGFNCQTGQGRVSSPLVKVHSSGLRVITQSGRLYDLIGAPGEPVQGQAVLANWLEARGALVLSNVTPVLMGWPGRDDVAAASVSASVH
jgi:hypothetical protein